MEGDCRDEEEQAQECSWHGTYRFAFMTMTACTGTGGKEEAGTNEPGPKEPGTEEIKPVTLTSSVHGTAVGPDSLRIRRIIRSPTDQGRKPGSR